MTKEKTNITGWHQEIFEEMVAGHPGYTLFSVTFDGEPTAAIVRCEPHPDDEEHVIIRPVAVMVTDEMALKLKDHEGVAPKDGGGR